VSVLKKPKFIVGAIVMLAVMVGSRLLMPITLPPISLAPEAIAQVGPLPIMNTMLALVVAEVILLVLVFLATRRMAMVPGRLQNFFEAIVEFWETQADQLVGPKLTRTWLPLVLTVFLLVWFSNYLHFLPGFDSIGLLCAPGTCPGQTAASTAEGGAHHTLYRATTGPLGLRFISAMPAADAHAAPAGEAGGAAPSGEHATTAATEPAAGEPAAEGLMFVPLLRVAASDLNFTIALAVICFLAVEIAGFRTWGRRYLTKFFHFDFSHGVPTGLLNLFVGLIELVSELARMLSWSFRLFGNIFAGSVLLVVFMFLIPLLAAVPVYGLELFVGLIQAYVFAILILAFMTLAVAPPHGGDHH
jgi:F-type H+-transporting ATPase subunit a